MIEPFACSFTDDLCQHVSVGAVTLLKFAVGVLAGVCLALASAAEVLLNTTLNNWACYEAFVVNLVNGPAVVNFVVDVVSTAAMSRYFRTANMFPLVLLAVAPWTSLSCFSAALARALSRVAIGVLVALALVVATHWTAGYATFAAVLLIVLAPSISLLAIGVVFTNLRLEYGATWRVLWRALSIFAVIGIAIVLNVACIIPLPFLLILQCSCLRMHAGAKAYATSTCSRGCCTRCSACCGVFVCTLQGLMLG